MLKRDRQAVLTYPLTPYPVGAKQSKSARNARWVWGIPPDPPHFLALRASVGLLFVMEVTP